MAERRNDPSLDTLFAQLDGALDQTTGAVVPPIQTATTFARNEDYSLVSDIHIYGRDDNDVVRLAESVLAKAERADAGLLFPSGMAAIAAAVRTVPTGGSLIFQSGIYWGTTKWVRDFCTRRQIKLAEVDAADTPLLTAAIATKNPDMVFVETPSNPWLKTVDVTAISAACRVANATLVVDSTAATPVLSQPLELGADIVMHSATKAINGHSDVLAGFLGCAREADPLWQAIRMDRHDAGAILGGFEAWLLLRGMRTLPLRMERMCQNAQKIAEFLHAHRAVTDVYYPGLPTHAGHDLAQNQMQGGFGGLLSLLVDGDGAKTLAVCGKLNRFHRATSLGGVESLVEHRHTIEGDATGIPPNLLRLAIGIENIDDLIADLDQALVG